MKQFVFKRTPDADNIEGDGTDLPQPEKVNILVVDDLPEKILVYRTILDDLQQNIITANSGEEALKQVLKHEFAVILLDVNMPGMDGFETASLIRGRKKSANTPIIFLTAFTDDINAAQGYASGAVDYLPTPVMPEVLKAKIRVFIELFQMRQQAAFQAVEKAKREAAEEADRRKDEFLATLAHELRNPLAPLQNALHILQQPGLKPGMLGETCRVMSQQLDHMVRLVDDLMDISRISRGKIELRLDNISLSDALNNGIETARPLISIRNHTLQIDKPGNNIMVRGDMVRLSQVFTNLLNNAAKYTDPGGTITVSVDCADDFVNVTIRDTGVGIPTERLEDIFGLFTQVDNSISRAQGGLGVGLTLARDLVRMQHGTITASSDGPGKGSTFTVRLPVVEPSISEQIAEKAGSTAADGHSCRVLVVDDNEAAATTMGWMLESLGHNVKLAYEGKSAIDTAREFHPELVLLDIGMPGMNGYEICKTLRQDDAFQQTTFVAQTGWGQEEHRRRSKEAGFDHHLVKPVQFKDLDKILDSIMAKSPEMKSSSSF